MIINKLLLQNLIILIHSNNKIKIILGEIQVISMFRVISTNNKMILGDQQVMHKYMNKYELLIKFKY